MSIGETILVGNIQAFPALDISGMGRYRRVRRVAPADTTMQIGIAINVPMATSTTMPR